MSRETRRWIARITMITFLVALWWFVLPPQLGGRTTFLTTHGTSMEPLLHDGDLAVLHKSSHYQVGQIIEYHSTTLNAPILHRIISIDQQGISTKGDNNNFIDLDHPSGKQIHGRLDHRFQGMGHYVNLLKSVPARIIGASLVGLAVFFALRKDDDKKAKRRRSKPSKGGTDGTNGTPVASGLSRARNLRQTAPLAFMSIVLMISIVTTSMGFSRPVSSSKPLETIYNLTGKFGYSAQATGGDLVYPNGQVSTGDPVYLSMVNQMLITYSLQVSSPSRFKGGGDVEIMVILKGKSGWTHEIPLSAKRSFTGDHARATAVIDIQQLRSVVADIQKLTKVPEGTFTIAIKPSINVTGTLGGAKLQAAYSPELDFNATSTQLTVQKGNGDSPAAPNGKTPNQTDNGLTNNSGGTLTIPRGTPAALRALGHAIGIATLRTVGLSGLLVSSVSILFLVLGRRRQKFASLGPFERTLREHNDLFVPVAGWGVAGHSMIIDVPELTDLAKLAEQHETLILRETSESEETFVVNNGHITYRFRHSIPAADIRFGATREQTTGTKVSAS